MNKPHKHCEVIKAWADGAEIQYREKGGWMKCNSPQWFEETEYRVKPKAIRYRVALLNKSNGWPYTIAINIPSEEQRTKEWSHFDRWLTDWIEVEV